MKTVSESYIQGISEGRAYLKEFPNQTADDIKHHLVNIRATINFSALEVKEILRGERDFWINQLKTKVAT